MRIMVALDGSDHALVALEYVACLALTASDEVILVSVAETEPVPAKALRRQHGRHLSLLLEATWAAKRASAQRTLERGQDRLGEWQAPVTQVIRSGHPVKAIAGLVGELAADLLVLGPRGRGQLEALLLGSVTQSLLGLARCPVLVARQPVDPPHRVILATDGSPHADAATRVLAAFPLADDATIDVVTVVPPWTPPDHDGAADGYSALLAAQMGLAHDGATAAVEALTAWGWAAQVSMRAGDPGREIAEAARTTHANLVVVGARGLGRVRGLLLGSVSRRVAATAPCSVLVVPALGRTDRRRKGGAVSLAREAAGFAPRAAAEG